MQQLTVSTQIHAPLEKVWQLYTTPDAITQWNHASDDWHSPSATVDLRPGGNFSFRMEAKDNSAGFDFAGTYDQIIPLEKISYTFGDRKATILFHTSGEYVDVQVSFDPEETNSLEMQRDGWQAILNNFKQFVETQKS